MSKKGKTSAKLLVAAIDFGTTFSGWSFLFGNQFVADPTKVFAKNWNNGTNISSKTPTTILIKSDGETMEKFGYEAEDRYAALANDENKHRGYYYFRRFKMALHDKQPLKRDIYLDDGNGNQLPALRVFRLAIKYLHDNLLTECNKQISGESIDVDDIDWVITVPAIWNDAAKQFMREAAEMAGIKTNKLTVALEPEAASLFCKHLAIERHVGGEGMDLDSFSPGSQYIVLDAGGGTVDITVHEVLPDGDIKELHSASGGAWGGTNVDENFLQFLIKIFGGPIFKKFKRENMDDYIDLFREFEVKKRAVSFEDTTAQLRLPATLVERFNTDTEESLKETIQQMSFKGTVSLTTGNKLRLDADCMRSFFGSAIKSIVEHLQELTMDPVIKNTNVVLMVGGFSESVYLQDSIKRKFPNKKIIIPPEAGLVVLKGAAIFGHSTHAIAERRSKYTYGFCGFTDFKEGVDPEEQAVMRDNKTKRLRGAFFKLVEIGEPIGIDERREWKGNRVAHSDKDIITFPLHASSQSNPRGAWSENTHFIGKLTAKISNMSVPRNDRKFRIAGIFGKTEIELQALELSTGKLTTTKFDAL